MKNTAGRKIITAAPYSTSTIQQYLKDRAAFEAWQTLNDQGKKKSENDGFQKENNKEASINTLKDGDIDIIISGCPQGHQVFSLIENEATEYSHFLQNYDHTLYPEQGQKYIHHNKYHGGDEIFIAMQSLEKGDRKGGYAGITLRLHNGYKLKLAYEKAFMEAVFDQLVGDDKDTSKFFGKTENGLIQRRTDDKTHILRVLKAFKNWILTEINTGEYSSYFEKI